VQAAERRLQGRRDDEREQDRREHRDGDLAGVVRGQRRAARGEPAQRAPGRRARRRRRGCGQRDGLGAPTAIRAGAREAYEAFGLRLRRDPPASDRASDAMPADDPWRPYLDALSGYMNGVGTEGLSVRDFLAYDDAASEAYVVGSTITVALHGTPAADALAAIDRAGIGTGAISTRRPTLDDVYLRLTGAVVAAVA